MTATDVESDDLTYTLVSVPSKGTLSNVDLPQLTYHPQANFNGTDRLTYAVSDGELSSDIATVDITIVAVNGPPLARDQSVTVSEDGSLSIVLTAVDIEDQALTYQVVSSPSQGTLTGEAPNLTYTPVTDYHGPDSFSFKVNDGAADSQTATVNLNVGNDSSYVQGFKG